MKLGFTNFALILSTVLATATGAAPAAPAGDAPADDAATLMYPIETMGPPEADPTRFADRAYIKEYDERLQAFRQLQSARIKALTERFAADPKVKKFLMDRWLQLARTGEKDLVIEETTPFLAGKSDPGE